MSIQSLERAIVSGLRLEVKNPKLTINQVLEWSTSEEQVKKNLQPTDVMVELPGLGVFCAILKSVDKRPTTQP